MIELAEWLDNASVHSLQTLEGNMSTAEVLQRHTGHHSMVDIRCGCCVRAAYAAPPAHALCLSSAYIVWIMIGTQYAPSSFNICIRQQHASLDQIVKVFWGFWFLGSQNPRPAAGRGGRSSCISEGCVRRPHSEQPWSAWDMFPTPVCRDTVNLPYVGTNFLRLAVLRQGIVQKLKWNVPIREPCAPSPGFMPRANAGCDIDD